MGRLEGSLEESLGQSAALGNFSEPDQSWTHFRNVPEAATSSAHDGLVLGALDQKASVGMDVVPEMTNLPAEELVVVLEEGPACEGHKERVLVLLVGATHRRVVGSCRCVWLSLVALASLIVVQVEQVVLPGDSHTVPAFAQRREGRAFRLACTPE